MSLLSQKILGIRVTTSPKQTILEEIRKYLVHGSRLTAKSRKTEQKPLVIATPNPEQIILAQKNTAFAQILNRADIELPDGIGIAFASQLLTQVTGNSKQLTVRERIPGVEFMEDLVRLAEEQAVRIGLIGGRRGVAVKALECLRQKYPNLEGWAENGPDLTGEVSTAIDGLGEDYWRSLVKKIETTHTSMVFVGLGAPKQEFFIEAIRRQLSAIRSSDDRRLKTDSFPIILMSVGGSFDILSGTIQRASLLIRSIGLEWFWRLVQEPWRLRRQYALVRFVLLVLKEQIRHS